MSDTPSVHKSKRKASKKDASAQVSKKTKVDAANSSAYTSNTASEDSASHIGRKFTVSVALPGSIVDNAQSAELRTYLCGQIARAAAIFQIDEIVVFDDKCSSGSVKATEGAAAAADKSWNPNAFLARLLQYLETPQ